MNNLVSQNEITSYEQFRNIFLNTRNKILGFLYKNKEKIEKLLQYLNQKRNDAENLLQSNSRKIFKSNFFLIFFSSILL